jgi:cytochrome c
MAPAGGAAAGVGEGAGQPEEANEGDCVVVADADPDYGPPPLGVAFTAEAECTGGQPTYKWDFGDGSPPSSEANPSHTYTKAGDFTATVTVTGSNGAVGSDEIDITVEEGAPEAE